MKKVMITTATVFALAMSAGMSMAGPLRDHGQRGNAHNARSSVSQALNTAATKANTYQSDPSFASPSDRYTGQNNLSSTQQISTSSSKWSSEFPNVVTITVSDNGNYTWIFGKTTGANLTDQPIWMYR